MCKERGGVLWVKTKIRREETYLSVQEIRDPKFGHLKKTRLILKINSKKFEFQMITNKNLIFLLKTFLCRRIDTNFGFIRASELVEEPYQWPNPGIIKFRYSTRVYRLIMYF